MPMRRQALRSIEPLATSLFFSLILIFFFTLPSLLAKAEPFSPGTSEPTRVNPGDMNSGALLLPTEDGGFVQAPRLGTDVVMTSTARSRAPPSPSASRIRPKAGSKASMSSRCPSSPPSMRCACRSASA